MYSTKPTSEGLAPIIGEKEYVCQYTTQTQQDWRPVIHAELLSTEKYSHVLTFLTWNMVSEPSEGRSGTKCLMHSSFPSKEATLLISCNKGRLSLPLVWCSVHCRVYIISMVD